MKTLIIKPCLYCHKEFEARPGQKFCCGRHGDLYRYRAKRHNSNYQLKSATIKQDVEKPPKKSLAEWEREATECNLDYGNYRALLNVGKTYEELKALADGRGIRYHSCGYPKNTRSPQASYGRLI